jgi:hypothetical protein
MNAKFTGNGADLPVVGVKTAANLRTRFGIDHSGEPPFLWNAWKRINEAPPSSADTATQYDQRLLFQSEGSRRESF